MRPLCYSAREPATASDVSAVPVGLLGLKEADMNRTYTHRTALGSDAGDRVGLHRRPGAKHDELHREFGRQHDHDHDNATAGATAAWKPAHDDDRTQRTHPDDDHADHTRRRPR